MKQLHKHYRNRCKPLLLDWVVLGNNFYVIKPFRTRSGKLGNQLHLITDTLQIWKLADVY